MAELPSGTVTLLFTDIEGSTRLLQELGRERYMRALSDQRRLVREAFTRNGGVEVEMQGDSFHFAFARADEAVVAAAEAQRALAEHAWESEPIRIRIGIHTGEPVPHEGLYAGLDVHRAARIMSAGHGGQILLSQTTRDLLGYGVELRDMGEHRLKDLALVDLGPHRLKDLAEPLRLYQLGKQRFPPLMSLHETKLPIPPTAFLGRKRELEEVVDRLSRDGVRLLTLTGAGGTGKTRLALQAAKDVAVLFPDGVFWVGLASLRDPKLVLPTIAQALDTTDELAARIGSSRMLLVLDNFEHLLGAAVLVADVLSTCPELRVLVTSRERLNLAAESEYPVRPLREEDAVALFHARLQATGTQTEANNEVREICRRLDNLPLAIELAASQIRTLPPAALLERLERRLPLLTGGPRDLPQRQQTLRSTISWSHELLAPHEQALFRRLSVFPGGCTFDAATAVCGAAPKTLVSLVDRSLLLSRNGRFRMLETIREYAAERLDEVGEREDLERRHADYYAAFAIGLEEAFFGPEGTRAHQQLEPEHENLRAALDYLLERKETESGLRVANALAPFWRSSHNQEGLRWLEKALTDQDAVSSLHVRGHLRAGVLATRCGDPAKARWHGERTLEIARELGDRTAEASAEVNLGILAVHARDFETASTRFEQAADYFVEIRDGYRGSQALNNLAVVHLLQGDHERAADLVARGLKLLPEGEEEETASLLHTDGAIRLAVGDLEGAGSIFERLTAIGASLHDTTLIAAGVEGVASVAAAQEAWPRAATLFAFVEAYCAANDVSDPVTRELAEPYQHRVDRRADDELEEARDRGATMAVKEAVAYALEPGRVVA
jgi:predicted ATPase/class 3 adenylate cyclase